MPRKRTVPYTSSDDFLRHFFVEVLLLVLQMPDSLIDELEEAIKLARTNKEETRQRLEAMKARKA